MLLPIIPAAVNVSSRSACGPYCDPVVVQDPPLPAGEEVTVCPFNLIDIIWAGLHMVESVSLIDRCTYALPNGSVDDPPNSGRTRQALSNEGEQY